MNNPINIKYHVSGINFPIQFIVPPNPSLTTTDNGTTLVVTRPGSYYITADRSHIPPMFRNQVHLNITDQARHKITAKGDHQKYVATLIVDPSEIGTTASKFHAIMNAPFLPPFSGTLSVVPGPLPY